MIRRLAIAAVSLLLPSAAFAAIGEGSLRVRRDGDDVVLEWSAGTAPYAVFRNDGPAGVVTPAGYVTSTNALSHLDAGAALDPADAYYFVGDELECLAPADCDDGTPCNGLETCDLAVGVCGPAPPLARSTVDRPDYVTGPQLHMTYVLPADGTDEQLDVLGQLDDEVRVAQRWLQEQTGDCMKFDTFEGSLDVTFVRTTRTNDEIRNHPDFVDRQIGFELEARGLDDPEKLYVVYYGGTADAGECGGAAAAGGPAMQFLVERQPGGSLTPCPYFAFVSGPDDDFRGRWAGVMMHESVHGLGFVASCAPDHDDAHPAHLATISSDLMAYDGTGYDVYTLDENRTEYYAHGDPTCPDLRNSAVWHVSVPGPDPIPNKTDWQDPVDIACVDEPGSASGTGGAFAWARFANASGRNVRFYWLDFAGNRQPSEFVPPWTSFCCGTSSEFHVFVATDADTGECLGLYELVPGFNRMMITE